MNARLYCEFFRALGNPIRISVVQLLRERPHFVNELAQTLGIEQSRVSHNLACLLNCGFVEWEWKGKHKVYRLNPDLGAVLAGIDRHLARYSRALHACETLRSEATDGLPKKATASTRELRAGGRRGRKRSLSRAARLRSGSQ